MLSSCDVHIMLMCSIVSCFAPLSGLAQSVVIFLLSLSLSRRSWSNSVQTLHVARNVVSETCRALGFNDIQIASVYSAFDKAMKDDQAHELSTYESYADPIPATAAYHLVRGCVVAVLHHLSVARCYVQIPGASAINVPVCLFPR